MTETNESSHISDDADALKIDILIHYDFILLFSGSIKLIKLLITQLYLMYSYSTLFDKSVLYDNIQLRSYHIV